MAIATEFVPTTEYIGDSAALTVPEQLGRIVRPAVVPTAVADRAYYEIVNPLREELSGEPADYPTSETQLEIERKFKEGLDLRSLFVDPYDTVVKRSLLLALMYEDRQVAADKSSVVRFGTRNYERDGIDLAFTVNRKTPELPAVSIETRMQNQLETPCRITAARGVLAVSQRHWSRGEWRDTPLSTDEGERGRNILKALFADMVFVVDLRSSLSVAEMAQSDRAATRLMATHLDRGRTLVPSITPQPYRDHREDLNIFVPR